MCPSIVRSTFWSLCCKASINTHTPPKMYNFSEYKFRMQCLCSFRLHCCFSNVPWIFRITKYKILPAGMNRRRKWSILPSSSTSLVVVIVMRMDRIIWPFSLHSFNRKLFVEIYQALKWMGKYDGGTKDTERAKERAEWGEKCWDSGQNTANSRTHPSIYRWVQHSSAKTFRNIFGGIIYRFL